MIICSKVQGSFELGKSRMENLDELLHELERDPRYVKVASQIRDLFLKETDNPDPLGLNMDPSCDGFAFAARLIETGVMTAALFHEINQPLLGIKGFAELIRDKSKEPAESKVKDWALEIRRQVDRVLQMQKKVSSYLKPSDSEATTASLEKCVDEAIGLFEHRLIKKRVSIHLDIPSDMPELRLPSMHLVQILVNLVANALDALDQVKDLSGRKLGIMASHQGQPLRTILVADTGPGISPEQLPELFVPFKTTKGERGSGLGLIISRRLAQAYGGELDLLPMSDKSHQGWPGAVFELRLPLVHVPASVDQGSDGEAEIEEVNEFNTDTSKELAQLELDLIKFGRELEITQRVLLAYDNGPEQLDLLEALAQHSILADVVVNAEQAMERLAKRPYAVLITDMLLADTSAIDLLSRVRNNSPNTQVLVCTDTQSIQSTIDALDKGASDYIPKPFPSRPFLTWKVKAAQARYDFEMRTSSAVEFLKDRSEKLALQKGKDVITSCAIPLKRALDSYQSTEDHTTIGVFGNRVLVQSAASLGFDVIHLKDVASAIGHVSSEKIQVLVLVEDEELDAVDLIYQVRQLECGVAVFVIAQEKRLDDLVQAIGNAVGDYLLRPLEGREFFPSKLKKLVSRRDKQLRYLRLLKELKALNLDLQKAIG